MVRQRFLRLAATGLICAAMALALKLGTTHADGPVITSDPPEIRIAAEKDTGFFQASFHLSTTQLISNLQWTVDELRPVADESGLLASLAPAQVRVQPASAATLTLGQRRPFTVEIMPKPATFGTWSGNLVAQWTLPHPGMLVIPITVESRSRPALVVYDPAKVTIEAYRGQVVTRTVILRETVGGSAVTGLGIDVPDLRTDGQSAIVPAKQIQATVPLSSIPHGYPNLTLSVDLRGVVAGSYSGKLLVTSDNADDVPVEVTVKVKHRPWGPVLWMLLGLACATGLNQVKTIRARDRVRMGVNRLRSLLKIDDKFRQHCEDWLGREIDAIYDDLREDKVADAQSKVSSALHFYERWDYNQNYYIDNIDWIGRLLSDTDPYESAPFVRALREHLQTVSEAFPEMYAGPEEMRRDILRVDEALQSYRNVIKAVADLRQEVEKSVLLATDRDAVSSCIVSITKDLDTMAAPSILANGSIPLPQRLLDLPSEVIDCRRKLDAARRQAESAIRRLVGCFNATGELLERTSTDDVQGARFGELVLRAIERGQESVKTEAHQGRFEVAADQAQNVWWAAVHEVRFLASARALVASQRGDAAQLQEAVAAFEGFLTDAESYWFLLPPGNLPPNDGTDGEPMPFSGTVRDLRRRIRSEAARLDPASVLVKWSPPDRLPEGSLDLVSVTGRSVVSEAYMMGKDLLEARPTMPESSPPSARLEWQLSRLQQAWSRVAPAVRYGLLTALTVVVSLLLLALLGIKEQYLDNPTFGSFGDYLKLFLWGFGVEMSTSKVLELVSGWGMFAESTE